MLTIGEGTTERKLKQKNKILYLSHNSVFHCIKKIHPIIIPHVQRSMWGNQHWHALVE